MIMMPLTMVMAMITVIKSPYLMIVGRVNVRNHCIAMYMYFMSSLITTADTFMGSGADKLCHRAEEMKT